MKTGVFLSSDVLLINYIYEYVCAYMCVIFICVYMHVFSMCIHMCMYICIYSNITINTESTFLLALSQEDNNEAPEGWGLSHAVRGGTEGFHGLFKLLEIFLTLIFTFI